MKPGGKKISASFVGSHLLALTHLKGKYIKFQTPSCSTGRLIQRDLLLIDSIPADSKEGFNADTPKDREYCTVVNFKIVRFRRMEQQDVKMIFFS